MSRPRKRVPDHGDSSRDDSSRGRYALPASIVLLAAALLFSLRSSTTADIDLRRLGSAVPEGTERATLVMEEGRVWNRGDVTAENVEILAPRYQLVGRIDPNGSAPAPEGAFRLRYEWSSRSGIRTETKQFERPRRSDTGTVSARAGASPAAPAHSTGRGHDAGLADTLAPTPSDLVAAYDPATHLLTIRAGRTLNVRADGFLLRPVRRSTGDGIEYRYLPANVLVLGQNLARGEAVAFEVVFTRPQAHYSLPLYVWEDGSAPVYVEVGVEVGVTAGAPPAPGAVS